MAQSINNLSLGYDLVKIPVKATYQSFLGEYIYCMLVDKNHTGYPSNTVTLMSVNIIALICADAKEPSNSNTQRKNYGNNRYIYSNIQQWLDSTGGAGSWYTAQHTTDAPPTTANVMNGRNAYDGRTGFLTMLDSKFVSELQDTTLRVTKNTSTDGGGSETFTAKVFIPSWTELTGESVNSIAEGTQFALFSGSGWADGAKAKPTTYAVNNSEYTNADLSANLYWKYWTRSPYTTNPSSQYAVKADGTQTNQGCHSDSTGVRIAFNLPTTLKVSDTYDPNDGAYTIIYNTAPTAPASINVPTLYGGQNATISWSASTDPDGNLAGYKLEKQINGTGVFSQIYQGSNTSYTDTISNGTNSVIYRVKAYDTSGDESSYTTANSVSVIWNQPPAISGSDGDLGTKSAGFTQTYTVTDTESDSVTVTETIDGEELRTYIVTLGATNTFSVTGETWLKLNNGTHTMVITARDATGIARRTYTFTKSVDTLSVVNTLPMLASSKPTRIKITVTRNIPPTADFAVYVCNNGFDSSPTWEDATSSVITGFAHVFSNSSKTASDWGIKVKVEIDRNGAEGECYISQIGGNFE